MSVRVIISGFVQGIGFRQFIKYKAKKLNVKGWVKNLPASPAGGPDGKVEAVFAGNKDDVEKMIEFCRKGPFLAQVKNVEVKELPGQEFEDFKIIH